MISRFPKDPPKSRSTNKTSVIFKRQLPKGSLNSYFSNLRYRKSLGQDMAIWLAFGLRGNAFFHTKFHFWQNFCFNLISDNATFLGHFCAGEVPQLVFVTKINKFGVLSPKLFCVSVISYHTHCKLMIAYYDNPSVMQIASNWHWIWLITGLQ